MKPYVAALALCPLLVFSAWSQSPSPQPLSLQEFLGLTGDQFATIDKNNNDYNTYAFYQQQQIQQAQSQIAVETAKDELDPMTLGMLYASIESTCRSIRDKAANFQQLNISLLTDAQKVKLTVLNDAMRLVPAISQAQLENFLGSAVSAPDSFATAWFNGAYYNGFRLRSVSGCGSTVPVTIFPANPLAAVAPTGTSQSGVGGGVFRVGGGLPGPVLLYKVEPGSVGPLPKPRSQQ